MDVGCTARVAVISAILLIVAVPASAGPEVSAAGATGGVPAERSQSVMGGAINGAKRGALIGGIVGGVLGFFALARRAASRAGRGEEPNNDKPGRPYF